MKKYILFLWTLAVYGLSFLCYLPLLLTRLGVGVPDTLLHSGAGFVLVPGAASAVVLAKERRLGAHLSARLKGISLREAAACGLAACLGLGVAVCCSFLQGENLLLSAYPGVLPLAVQCAYLFCTAFAEEFGWRGFLLDRLADGGSPHAPLLAGAAWVGWHLPMWAIRNSLSAKEILPLFFWALVVSQALARLYLSRRSLLSAALLHMICNVCFLAPPLYNALALFCALLAARVIKRLRPAV